MRSECHRVTSPTEVDSVELSVTTPASPAVIDLTSECAEFVSGRGNGLLSVFVPHATAGVAILEIGAGSDHDLLETLDELLPARPGRWGHQHGSPGHGRDHVLPAFICPSVTVPVVGGRMTLGTWQSVALVDTNRDNLDRRVRLTFLIG